RPAVRRRGGPGGRGGALRRLPLRPGAARPGAGHPDERRAAPLELPAVAGGVRGALLLGQALARLHARGPARRARPLRPLPAPLPSPVAPSMLASRLAIAL